MTKGQKGTAGTLIQFGTLWLKTYFFIIHWYALLKDVIFKKQLEISFEQLNFLWKTIRIVYKTLWKCIPDTKIEFGLSLYMLVIGTQIIGELFIFKPGSLEDK